MPAIPRAKPRGTGIDRVESTVTFTLAAGVENLILNGTSAINGTGNAGVNAITGNSAANTLSGLAANDTLSGFGGADRLDGGTGGDAMTGGNGDDTYIVENAADTTVEASSGGTDMVQSTVTFTLSANVENLALNGTAAINGTGNASANTMSGNSAREPPRRRRRQRYDDRLRRGRRLRLRRRRRGRHLTDFANGSDTCDLTAVAGVDDSPTSTVIDNGATVTVNYGTGSFTFANIANAALIDASDFVF